VVGGGGGGGGDGKGGDEGGDGGLRRTVGGKQVMNQRLCVYRWWWWGWLAVLEPAVSDDAAVLHQGRPTVCESNPGGETAVSKLHEAVVMM
jgi:hypothetical protein